VTCLIALIASQPTRASRPTPARACTRSVAASRLASPTARGGHEQVAITDPISEACAGDEQFHTHPRMGAQTRELITAVVAPRRIDRHEVSTVRALMGQIRPAHPDRGPAVWTAHHISTQPAEGGPRERPPTLSQRVNAPLGIDPTSSIAAERERSSRPDRRRPSTKDLHASTFTRRGHQRRCRARSEPHRSIPDRISVDPLRATITCAPSEDRAGPPLADLGAISADTAGAAHLRSVTRWRGELRAVSDFAAVRARLTSHHLCPRAPEIDSLSLMVGCIFCAIAAGEAPATIIDQDQDTIAFMDINPWRRGHALVVPRRHYENLLDIDPEDLTKTFATAQRVAARMKDGLGAERVVLWNSCGAAAGQVVMHFHVHVVPANPDDPPLPPRPESPADESDIAAAAAALRNGS